PGARRRTGRTAADHARAVHEPVHNLPAAGVVPNDVAQAVAIEVVGASGPCGEHPGRASATVVPRPAHDGSVAGQCNRAALVGGSNRAGADQLVALLRPDTTVAAGEHPRCACKIVVGPPTHDGGEGVAVGGQRDGAALLGYANHAGADQLALLCPPKAPVD